jgi:hypothetical protein
MKTKLVLALLSAIHSGGTLFNVSLVPGADFTTDSTIQGISNAH